MKDLPEIVFLDAQRKDELDHFFEEWFSDIPYLEINTSGSTGKPKTLRIEKEYMRVSARKTICFFDLTKENSCYHCLSTNTIGGKMMLVRALELGMKIIVGKVNAFSLEELNQKVDFAALVPLQLDYILKNNPKKLQLLKTIIVGGAPVSVSTIQLLKANRASVYQTFGMTETISHVALRKIGFEEQANYQGLENISFSQIDGKLVVHYPEIGRDHLLTNDLVEIISSDQFKWLGRGDFVINSGGYKFSPELIEAKLSTHLSVPFFIHGLPDEKLGQKIVLFIEGNSSLSLPDFKQILDKYEVPKEIRFLEKFVRTSGDKINRIATSMSL